MAAAGGFGVYYLGFPLRGYRWALLLRGAGTEIRVRDSTEIIFISWLVNCLVPAKLGDVYRAYLLRLNFDVSLSRTFGTVFIERVFDLFAIVLLGLAAGFWSFRGGMSPEVQLVFAHRPRRSSPCCRSACTPSATSAAGSSPAAAAGTASSSSTTGSRRASSRSSRASCRSWRS